MIRLLAALLGLALLAGCVTEGRERHVAIPSPWPETDAPAAMAALAEDIAAFQATTGAMPDTLAAIDRLRISTRGPYAGLGYAYHPAGIGILREGWRVIAADDRVRTAGTVWCVVRPPVQVRNGAALRVVQVPMPELRDAAASAGSSR